MSKYITDKNFPAASQFRIRNWKILEVITCAIDQTIRHTDCKKTRCNNIYSGERSHSDFFDNKNYKFSSGDHQKIREISVTCQLNSGRYILVPSLDKKWLQGEFLIRPAITELVKNLRNFKSNVEPDKPLNAIKTRKSVFDEL